MNEGINQSALDGWWDLYHTGHIYFPEHVLVPILDWFVLKAQFYLKGGEIPQERILPTRPPGKRTSLRATAATSPPIPLANNPVQRLWLIIAAVPVISANGFCLLSPFTKFIKGNIARRVLCVSDHLAGDACAIRARRRGEERVLCHTSAISTAPDCPALSSRHFDSTNAFTLRGSCVSECSTGNKFGFISLRTCNSAIVISYLICRADAKAGRAIFPVWTFLSRVCARYFWISENLFLGSGVG